ncbi:ABC transporter permease [candidate division KSB1 bacterium]
MNLELFISKRILKKEGDYFSRPIIKIAIVSIALGLAMMIISVAILTGFQKEIRDKIIGFGAHIQISNYDANSSYETLPVSIDQAFYPSLDTIKGIRHIQVYAYKLGLIATRDENQGAVLKGIGSDYDWSFFSKKIIAGQHFFISDTGATNDVLISKYLSDLLFLKIGDKLRMYFIANDQKRARAFIIKGIYETGLEEFDKKFVICDIAHIQKLNGWENNQVTGFEVLIEDFDRLDELGKYVYEMIEYDMDARTIRELHPEIFDWLELSDMNVIIILVLMVMVAGITMISTLLILILERTNMIGILKALGTRNWSIQKIFLYNALYLITKGLLWGNLIAIVLLLIQKEFGVISLPQESYYVSQVPININIISMLLINLGTLIICILMLIIPSFIITRITPVKAIRFN